MEPAAKFLKSNRTLIPADYWRGKGVLDVPYPWLTPESIAFLDDLIQPHFSVLEFGSGGSTLWFAQKGVTLHSLEFGSELWFLEVQKRLLGNNLVTLCYADTDAKISKVIDKFRKPYDLILVDCGDRSPEMLRKVTAWVKPGCHLVLDNYGKFTESDISCIRKWEHFRFNDMKWDGNGTQISRKPE